MTTILQLNGSAAATESITTSLNDEVVSGLAANDPTATVIVRDLTELPVLDNARLVANNTPGDARTQEQVDAATVADQVIADLQAADVVVIGIPIYNFGVPSSVKAWMDLAARAGTTFQYTDAGPQGLLSGKRAIVSVASGGVRRGDAVDHATPHIETFLRFLGFEDISIVDSTGLLYDEGRVDDARAQIGQLVGA